MRKETSRSIAWRVNDLSLLPANWQTGTEWNQGDFSDGGQPVNDNAPSLLLANWNAGIPPMSEETATATEGTLNTLSAAAYEQSIR